MINKKYMCMILLLLFGRLLLIIEIIYYIELVDLFFLLEVVKCKYLIR